MDNTSSDTITVQTELCPAADNICAMKPKRDIDQPDVSAGTFDQHPMTPANAWTGINTKDCSIATAIASSKLLPVVVNESAALVE